MSINRLRMLMLATLAAGCAELPLVGTGPELDELAGEPVQIIQLQEYFPRYNSGISEQARLVVTSRAEWELAWRRVWHGHSPVPAAPAVDFDREVVLVAAMGGRSSGGYQIQVTQAAAQADRVVVRVVETSPGKGCFTTAAFSEPVDVVKLPRTALPIDFQTVKVVHECD
jgi:hypothetical protein